MSDQQVYSIFGIIKWGSKVLKVRVAEGVTNFFKLPFIPSAYVHRIWSNVYYVNTFFFTKRVGRMLVDRCTLVKIILFKSEIIKITADTIWAFHHGQSRQL